MAQCSPPKQLPPRPNSSTSSSSSKPSLPTTPATDYSFPTSHLLPEFLQGVLSSFPQVRDYAGSYGIDMDQSYPMQSTLHPLHSYLERWQTLKQFSDSKDDLIQQLLLGWNQAATELSEENEALKKELQNSLLDLENATSTRRELQIQVVTKDRQIQRFLQDNDGLKNRNPYVVIFIDGDGLLFQEKYIKQGIEGGKKAVYDLRSAITKFCDEYGDDVEIMAKVVANISGLSRALQREGTIQDGELREFALGFTQAKASFDFIDVGYGKERADSKIKEMTRWNLRNHNCKQVFLGISHDSGYAPFLDEILQDESTRQRVTLLEGFPTARELQATGVSIYSGLTENIFRKDKIATFIPNGYTNGYVKQQASTSISPSSSDRSDSPPAQPVLSTTSSWATVTRTVTPPPTITTPLAHRLPAPAKAKEQPPKWSPGPRGIDPLVKATSDALRSVKGREKGNKYCNNHYLRGSCAQRHSDCTFIHNAKPSADELAAMSLLTRMNPCSAGQNCYVEDCIYGHNCPNVRDGVCPNSYCKFSKELHPPNTTFANRHIKEN